MFLKLVFVDVLIFPQKRLVCSNIWGYQQMTSRNTFGMLILMRHIPELVEPLICTASLQFPVSNHLYENRSEKYNEVSVLPSL